MKIVYSPVEFTFELSVIFLLSISNPFSSNIFAMCEVVTEPNTLSSDPDLSLISRTKSPIFLAIFCADFRTSSCFLTVCLSFSSSILEFDLLASTQSP